MKIDLHMHSTISDGTDSPQKILKLAKENGLSIFALTDHDDLLGCEMLSYILEEDDPIFIRGIEISAKKEKNKYHILGYNYDLHAPSITGLVKKVSAIRQEKIRVRIAHLQNDCGMQFDEEDIQKILHLPNPGKPHLGNLMIKYGYASTIKEGLEKYLNNYHFRYEKINPKEAVEAIADAGGVPVLAHGLYGDGGQHLTEDELDERVRELTGYGLRGMECYYSQYTEEEQALTKRVCEKYDLTATAGSDYHGTNKTVPFAYNQYPESNSDERMHRFLAMCGIDV